MSTADRATYVGRKVYGRKGTKHASAAGKVTNTSTCRLTGCSAFRLHVLWPDGHRTYPCVKACVSRGDDALEIV